ncbi:MAG TPA: hypothetical protein VJ464_13350 [Blastocatellia bacterium]|nr:hypothetical protein [Blastocatellia bacterium]
MAYLTKDQVKQIIQKAPAGTSPAGIVAALRAKGHQLEGYDQPPTDESSNQPSKGFVQNFNDTATDVLKGAAKGAATTLLTVPQSIARVTAAVTHALEGGKLDESLGNLANVTTALIRKANSLPDSDPKKKQLMNLAEENIQHLESLRNDQAQTERKLERTNSTPDALKPKNTAQKVGGLIENAAEFFIPGGAVEDASKAISGGVKGLNLASKYGKGGKVVEKVLETGGKAASEAAGAATVTAAKTGGDLKQTGENAAIAAAIPTAGAFVDTVTAPVKKFLSEKLAPRFANSILRPLSKEFEFGKNPGAGVAKEGITANTMSGYLDAITKNKKGIGQQIEKALSHPKVASKVIDAEPLVLSPIDQAMERAVKNGEQDLYSRLVALREGLTKEFTPVEGKLVATASKNLKLNPKDTQLLKRQVGDATRWTGQAFDSDLNKVRVQIYRNLDKAIDGVAPGVDKLNARYANMLSAEKSLERTMNILERQHLASIKDLGVGATVAGATSVAQGKFDLNSVLAGFAGGALNKALGSTAVKSRIASSFADLSPSEKTKFTKVVVPLLRNAYLGASLPPR